MSDITLTRPQAGQHIVLESMPESRLILRFPTDQATLERSGDNLVFTFEDGSRIELSDFYTQYSQESMPDFVLDGTLVAGADFFNAFGPDLMPAAGPGAAARAARYNAFGNSDLADGIDHLTELDWNMALGVPSSEDEEATGVLDVSDNTVGEDVNAAPVISISGAVTVVESGVYVGGNQAKAGTPEVSGRINAHDPDGDALHFAFVGPDGNLVTSIATDYGVITINPDGSYTYVLNNDYANSMAEGDVAHEQFIVRVSDGRGGVVETTVGVDVVGSNDIPTLELTRSVLTITDGQAAGQIIDGGTALGDDPDAGHELRYSFGTDENGDPITSVSDDYGTLTIDPVTGEYVYTLNRDSEAVLRLGEEDSVVQRVVVVVTDEHGAYAEQPLEIIIRGVNDVPVINAVSESGQVIESGVFVGGNEAKAGTPEVSGRIDAQDPDGDPLHFAFTGPDGSPVSSVTTDYGVITINPDGSYTYVLNNESPRVNNLPEGAVVREDFTVQVSDGRGGVTEVTISVNVVGTNDIPSLELSRDVLTVSDDGAQTVTGAITDGGTALGDDPDAGHRLSYSFGTDENGDPITSITDEYGTLTINPVTGEYVYTLDKESQAVLELGDEDSVIQQVTVVVTDEYGAYAEHPLQIVIRGADDVPVIAPVVEHVKDKGVFGEGDVPPNTATGDYTGPDEGGHIKDGEHRLTFEGQLQGFDHEGSALTYGLVTEGLTAGGTLTLTNPGNPADTTTIDILSVSTSDGVTSIVTQAGTFTLDQDGRYTFEINDQEGGFVDSMAQGVQWHLNFEVTATDGRLTGSSSLTICIEGTNEAPTFTQLVHKDYLGNAETPPIEAGGAWVVEAAEQGRWRGDHSNRVSDHSDVLTGSFMADDRDNGERESLTFSAQFKDGSTSGKNQAALEALGGMELKGEPEDRVVTEPTRLAEHADKGEGSYAELAPGTYKVFHFEVGDFYLNVDTGEYYFDVNDASELVNRMNLGDTHSLNFSVTVTDRHGASDTHDFTINISGRNDRPELSVKETLSATDGQMATGYLTDLVDVKDADFGDSHTFFIVADPTMGGAYHGDYLGRQEDSPANNLDSYKPGTTLEGKYGTLTIDPDTGEYTYKLYGPGEGHDEAYNAVKNLDAGKVLEDEVFHIAVKDADGAFDIKALPITITGINDAPSIEWSKVHVKETGVQPGGNSATISDGKNNGFVFPQNERTEVEGDLKASDPDANAQLTYGIDVNGRQGGINETGITVTLYTGSGDTRQPVLDENGHPRTETLIILKNSVSIDPETGHEIQTIETNYGTLTLDTVSGHYTFSLNNDAAHHLGQGQKFDFHFTTTVEDEYHAQAHHMLGITVEGSNDKPRLELQDLNHLEQGRQDSFVVDEGKNTGEYGGGGKAVYLLGNAEPEDDDYGAQLQFGLMDGHFKGEELGAVPDGAKFETNADGSVSIKGDYGTLTIKPNGDFTYEVDNGKDSLANQLGQGQSGRDEFTILVKDEHGAWTSKPISVTVNGVNDPPYLESASGVSVTEHGHGWKDGSGFHGNTEVPGKAVSDTNQIMVKDPDSNLADEPFAVNTENKYGSHFSQGQLGEDENGWQTYATDMGVFHLDPDTGRYYFVLDNDAQAVKELNKGETAQRYLQFSVTDEHGAVLHSYVTVTIYGTNDKPTLSLGGESGNGLLEVIEDTRLSAEAGGKDDAGFQVQDDDLGGKLGETFTYGIVDKSLADTDQGGTPDFASARPGAHGTLSIDPRTGKYTYKLDNADPAVQGLADGETLTETFYVAVRDANGAFDIKEVTVIIHGKDDPIELVSSDGHVIQATDGGVEFGTNVLNPYDQDGKQASGGQFVVRPVDDPAAGDGGHLRYGFVTTDAQGNKVFHEGSYDTGYGILSIDAEGNFFFNLARDGESGARVDALNAGQVLKLQGIELGVRDDRHPEDMITSQKLDIYLHGTNDRPYFTVADGQGGFTRVEESMGPDGQPVFLLSSADTSRQTLVENGNQVIEGRITADDPDAAHGSSVAGPADPTGGLSFSLVNAAGQLTQVLEGRYGILELHQDGSYTYTLTRPDLLESLNPGQKLSQQEALAQEEFHIRVTDALNAFTDGKLVIDVTGTADTPVISGNNLYVQEDGGHVTRPVEGDHTGDPAIHDGRFSLGNLVDAEDQAAGDRSNVSWSVQGQGVETLEDGSTRIRGEWGTLTVHKDGSYTYTLTENSSEAIQAMNKGQFEHDSFFIQAVIAGGKTVTQEVTINIEGANDLPYFSTETKDFEGVVQKDVFEDNDTSETEHPSVIFTGTVGGGQDTDAGDNTFTYKLWNGQEAVTEIQTEYGTITIDPATGEYRYLLDNESKTLDEALKAAGDKSIFDKVQVVVLDPHGAVSEDKREIVIEIRPGTTPGGVELKLGPDSELEKTIQEDQGQDLRPGAGSSDTISVNGHLDAVRLDGTQAPDRVFGIMDSNGNQVQSSAATGSLSVDGKYGYLVIDPASGDYTYTLYNTKGYGLDENGRPVYGPVQALAEGEILNESFDLMLNGRPVGEQIVITIKGTNDAPIIDTYQNLEVVENTQGVTGLVGLTAEGSLQAYDIDHDASTASGTQTEKLIYGLKDGNQQPDGSWTVETEYGRVTLYKDADSGEWKYTYTVRDADGLPDHLSADQYLPDSFVVTVSDGMATTEQVVDVTIKGTNHGPELSAVLPDPLEVAEDGQTTAGGVLSALFTDDQGTGNLSFTVSAAEGGAGGLVAQGQYGVLRIKPDGTYEYVLNNADKAVQGLDDQNGGTETFWITATDAYGISRPVAITVNIKGSDDAPELSVDKVLTVREGDDASVSGKATAFDSDSVDQQPGALTFSLMVPESDADGAVRNEDGSVTNKYGTFTVNQDGTYTFTLNNDSDAVKALTAGSLTETTVTLAVTDSQGHTTTQTVKVDITGVNTAPENLTLDNPDNQATPLIEDSKGEDARFSGTAQAVDHDDAQAPTYFFLVNGQLLQEVDGTYGRISIDPATGEYAYVLDSGRDVTQGLRGGEHVSESFAVVAVDTLGARSEPQSVTVHIEGVNDAPANLTLDNPDNQTTPLVEDSQGADARFSGTAQATDPDAGEEPSYFFLVNGQLLQEVDGTYGRISIDPATGEYTYVLDSGRDATQGLSQGQPATESFAVVAVDTSGARSEPQSVTVHIEGVNDAPVITSSTQADEAGGSFSFTDVDVNDTHSLSVRVNGMDYKATGDGNVRSCTVAGLGVFTLSYDANAHAWIYAFAADADLVASTPLNTVETVGIQIVVDDGHAQAVTPASGGGSLSVSYTGSYVPPVQDPAPDGPQGAPLPAGTDNDAHYAASSGQEIAQPLDRLPSDASGEQPHAPDIPGTLPAPAPVDPSGGAEQTGGGQDTVDGPDSDGLGQQTEDDRDTSGTSQVGDGQDTVNGPDSDGMGQQTEDDRDTSGTSQVGGSGGEDDDLFDGQGDEILFGGGENGALYDVPENVRQDGATAGLADHPYGEADATLLPVLELDTGAPDLTDAEVLKDLGMLDSGSQSQGAGSASERLDAWTEGSHAVQTGEGASVSVQDPLQAQTDEAARQIENI